MTRRRLTPVPEEFRKPPKPDIRSARELMQRELPPVRWVIPGILPEGVNLLAGKSKIRKSWLLMGLCAAVAAGGMAFGKIPLERGESLYLALEDNERRMQSRLGKILGSSEAPEGFYYTTGFPRSDEGGVEALADHLDDNPDTRLVVIDTLERFRPLTGGQRGYHEDYTAASALSPIAAVYQVAVVIVHHTRKASAIDVLDEINATTGLMGAVDNFLILKAERGKPSATMFVDGRDIEESGEQALKWDRELHGWVLIGDAEETRLTEQRRAILEAIRNAGGPLGPKAISDITGISHGSVRNLLGKLAVDLRVESAGRGRWRLCEEPPLQPTAEEGHSGEAGNVLWSVRPSDLSPAARGDDSGGDSETPHGNAENPPTVTGVTGVTGKDDYGVSPASGDSDDSGDTSAESPIDKGDSAVTGAVTDQEGDDSHPWHCDCPECW